MKFILKAAFLKKLIDFNDKNHTLNRKSGLDVITSCT